MKLHLLAFAFVTLTSCTDSDSQIDGPIEYSVTGGFTGRGDGTPQLFVELDGSSVCRAPGFEQHFTLDAARVAALHDAIYEADLPVEAEYVGCCDFYVDSIAVHMDGLVHSVVIDRSATGVPSELADLVSTMSAIASSCDAP